MFPYLLLKLFLHQQIFFQNHQLSYEIDNHLQLLYQLAHQALNFIRLILQVKFEGYLNLEQQL
jgi:hypothetical protein